MQKPYTCIIIDDNMLDRMAVEQEVAKNDQVLCIGSFSNAMDALSFFNTAKPTIVFADIDMPEITGLDFISTINKEETLNVIISSHPEYALQGFQLKVFDFILKPVEEDRFDDCLKRLIDFLSLKEKAEAYDILFEQEEVIFKEGYATIKLHIGEIIYLEAFGDYTKVVTDKRNYLTLTTLSNFMSSLPEGKFMRIHRSYVVARSKVEQVGVKHIAIGNNLLPIGKTFLREAKRTFIQN